MKVTAVHNGNGFTGMIPDEETYNNVRDGKADWKPHVKEGLTRFIVPRSVFEHLLELDRQHSAAQERSQSDEGNNQ